MTQVVIDGSNLAHVGLKRPSLEQLLSAMSAVSSKFPELEVVTIVDASFRHRLAPAERRQFEDQSNELGIIQPFAGLTGKGDRMVLDLAAVDCGVVVSNDSFQEFHGQHPWLFEGGRLFGAVPAGNSWYISERSPVRSRTSSTSNDEVGHGNVDQSTNTLQKAISPKGAARFLKIATLADEPPIGWECQLSTGDEKFGGCNVTDGVVVAFSDRRGVGIDAKTGSIMWSLAGDWGTWTDDSSLGKPLVLMDNEGRTVGINVWTGVVEWEMPPEDNIGLMLGRGGFSRGDSIFDVRTGASLWTLEAPSFAAGDGIGWFTWITARELIAVSQVDASVVSWNTRTGRLLWSTAAPLGLSTTIGDYVLTGDGDSPIVLVSERCQGRARNVALDISSGEVAWSRESDGWSVAHLVTPTMTFIADSMGMTALDTSTGEVIWTNAASGRGFIRQSGNGVLVTDDAASVYRGVEARDGGVLWEMEAKPQMTGTGCGMWAWWGDHPLYEDECVGYVHDARSGKLLHTIDRCGLSLDIVDGWIFSTIQKTKVVAFHASNR